MITVTVTRSFNWKVTSIFKQLHSTLLSSSHKHLREHRKEKVSLSISPSEQYTNVHTHSYPTQRTNCKRQCEYGPLGQS